MGLIRFWLAVSVVVGHYPLRIGFQMFSGQIAVELFFIISGFYMSLIQGKYPGAFSFYASRFLRLWPVYILTVLAAIGFWLAAYFYLGREPTVAGSFEPGPLGQTLIWFSNFFMVGQDIPNLLNGSPSGIRLAIGSRAPDELWLAHLRQIGPAWSIGVEIWFYLLVPLLARVHTAGLIAIALASLSLRYYLGQELGIGLVYFFFPTQLCLFVFGMLAQRHGGGINKTIAVSVSFSAIALATFAFGQFQMHPDNLKWLLYFLFTVTITDLFHATMNSRLDRVVGEMSYPIYLTHELAYAILSVAGKRVGIEPTGEMLILVVVPISLLAVFLIDEPMNGIRHRTHPT